MKDETPKHSVDLCPGYEPHPWAIYDYCVAPVYVPKANQGGTLGPTYCGYPRAAHPALSATEGT